MQLSSGAIHVCDLNNIHRWVLVPVLQQECEALDGFYSSFEDSERLPGCIKGYSTINYNTWDGAVYYYAVYGVNNRAVCTSGSISQCANCAAGQYQDQTGQSSCKSCEAGQEAAADALSCVDCEAGTYSDDGTSCKQCADGSYQDQATQSSCKTCPEGFPIVNYENSGCQECNAGTYYVANSYVIAESSPYECQSGESLIVTAEECQDAATALGKSYVVLDGHWDYVPPGCHYNYDYQYMRFHTKLDSTYNNGYNARAVCESPQKCVDCAAGLFQDQTGQSSCKTCAVGQEAAANALSCDNCPAGKYSDDGTSCKQCAAGQYQDQATQSSCTACPVGFESAANFESCAPCQTPLTGSKLIGGVQTCVCPNNNQWYDGSACQTCPVGYSISSWNSECAQCAPGKYQDEAEQVDCKTCPEGFGSSAGATECEVFCEVGEYKFDNVCVSCPTGFFSSGGLNIACTEIAAPMMVSCPRLLCIQTRLHVPLEHQL